MMRDWILAFLLVLALGLAGSLFSNKEYFPCCEAHHGAL